MVYMFLQGVIVPSFLFFFFLLVYVLPCDRLRPTALLTLPQYLDDPTTMPPPDYC